MVHLSNGEASINTAALCGKRVPATDPNEWENNNPQPPACPDCLREYTARTANYHALATHPDRIG